MINSIKKIVPPFIWGLIGKGLRTFVDMAVEKGRKRELWASTVLLIASYIALFRVSVVGSSLFSLPIACYVFYWLHLLTKEPVVKKCYRPEWLDEDWWWNLDGWEFEEEVSSIFRLSGFHVQTTRKTGDGGVDIVLYKDKEKYLVQCKHWKDPVSVMPLRELNGVREDLHATRLIMVASNGLTRAGYEFVEGKPYYSVLDLQDIMGMAAEIIPDKL